MKFKTVVVVVFTVLAVTSSWLSRSLGRYLARSIILDSYSKIDSSAFQLPAEVNLAENDSQVHSDNKESDPDGQSGESIEVLPPLPPPPPSIIVNVMEMRRTGAYILPTLLPRIKRALDHHQGLSPSHPNYGKPWPSCALVGNSGTLLRGEQGEHIDSHAAVWRLNLARIEGLQAHVGSKTSIAFINGHRVNWCAKQEGCGCLFYGPRVPFLTSLWKDFHYKDLGVCKQAHPGEKFIVIDQAVKDFCAHLVAQYAARRIRLEQEKEPSVRAQYHRPPDFSTGLEAVVVALSVCSKISMFGYGKAEGVQHHYWENETQHEYGFHDYAAEQMFYQDLVNNAEIPLLSRGMKLPEVSIYY